MKTNLKILVLAVTAMVQIGCGKDSSNTAATNTAIPVTYHWSNGVCYSSTGPVVSNSYCSGTSGTTYFTYNGTCYLGTQATSSSYCTNLTSGYYPNPNNNICYAVTAVANTYCSGSTSTTTSCVGIYYLYLPYRFQTVNCSGANCSGYTLITQTGQMVTCY